MSEKVRVAIIGAGNIAGPYLEDLQNIEQVEVVGITDLDTRSAREKADKFGLALYTNTDTLLLDDEIEIVVNLTPPRAHKGIITKCLEAGKHVYSEKPLADTYADAQELVDLAKSKGLRLACSPFVSGGEAQQTAWKLVREGKLGHIRLAYAEVNWGRIESWHPAPQAFYEVGPMADVGVYPLTVLTTMFGAVKQVTSFGRTLMPDRVTTENVAFSPASPDFMVAMLETASGVLIRLTANFYVGHHTVQRPGIEIHGDKGSLNLSNWFEFSGDVTYTSFDDGEYQPVPLVRTPEHTGVPWGYGIAELASAIMEDRPHRFTGEQAAHLVEILDAVRVSNQTGETVQLKSTFTPSAPMDWAE